jgi:hypothetical protein
VLDNLILPVLDDFGPDIIINSAGQDNHYSDPLANMAITAQGYARLADKLKADIAVLEGGYSIEDALPYVNTGIILAMAGLDYSKVVEPDIHKAPTSQSPETTQYIRQLVDRQRELWANRLNLSRAAVAKAGDFWQRRRGIYYDDSGISEHQQETVRLCPDCHGFIAIATEAEGGDFGYNSAFAAVIPRQPCARCRRDAWDTVAAAKRQGKYQRYIVQDKENDILERV